MKTLAWNLLVSIGLTTPVLAEQYANTRDLKTVLGFEQSLDGTMHVYLEGWTSGSGCWNLSNNTKTRAEIPTKATLRTRYPGQEEAMFDRRENQLRLMQMAQVTQTPVFITCNEYGEIVGFKFNHNM